MNCIPKADCSDKETSLPPVQTIFIDAENWGDDDDSVLSSSSFGSVTADRRSIFGSYWKHDNGIHKCNTSGKKDIPSSLDVSSYTSKTETYAESSSGCGDEGTLDNDVDYTYERILKRNEDVEEGVSDESATQRRSIWGNRVRHSMSESDFACATKLLASPCYKKSKSTSALHRTQQPSSSCLRESRYSVSCVSARHQKPQLQRQGSSVRFSEENDVIQLDYYTENWAADGWSDWFA